MGDQKAVVRRAVGVDEAAIILGVSQKSIRAAIRWGQLPAIRLGRRIVVPIASIENLLRGEPLP